MLPKLIASYTIGDTSGVDFQTTKFLEIILNRKDK